MSAALQKPWTIDGFLTWAGRQEERYEFDGFQPVAMTGGSGMHNRICNNIWAALRIRLRGSPCDHYGPDLGVQTIGDTVRFPDALVTCTKFPLTERLAPGVVVVFEVVSPDSGHRDRIVKLREYAAVPSVRRYVIVESATMALTVHSRLAAGDPWTTDTRTAEETLELDQIGVALPVAEIYEDIDLPDTP